MIKKIRVTVDGKPYDVTVEIPDEPAPAVNPLPAAPATASAPVEPSPPSAPSPAPVQSAAAGDIPSPLAGHIVGIAVTVGQTVKKGDALVTVEAMKMNTFVLAPTDGKVAAIHVKTGDVVSDGQSLARLE